MGNTRDLNSLLGELRRQLGALSKAIATFEDMAERKLEEQHSKSQSLIALSKALASENSATEGQALASVWSRPECVARSVTPTGVTGGKNIGVTAAADGPSSWRARES